MNEKEKQAIETLKEITQAIKCRPWISIPSDTKLFDTILNIINNQQKEIKELKEMNNNLVKAIEEWINGERINDIKHISKDKIRAKIKELKKMKLTKGDIFFKMRNYAILILRELLEE